MSSTSTGPVVYMATFKTKPGRRADLLEALGPLVKSTVEGEPHTYVYTVQSPSKDPDTVVFYEYYANAEAFKLHGSNFNKLAPKKEVLAGLLAAPLKLEAYDLLAGKLTPPSVTPAKKEIDVGDKVPEAQLGVTVNGAVKIIPSASVFKNKKVLLFAVPGPFTPGCTNVHLPAIAANFGELKAKGVDIIACLAVSNPYVMEAWKQSTAPTTQVLFLSDYTTEFTLQSGLTSQTPIGPISTRYALLVNNGVVVQKFVDHDNKVKNSSAEVVLAKL